jgi:hypothetical protein
MFKQHTPAVALDQVDGSFQETSITCQSWEAHPRVLQGSSGYKKQEADQHSSLLSLETIVSQLHICDQCCVQGIMTIIPGAKISAGFLLGGPSDFLWFLLRMVPWGPLGSLGVVERKD